MPELPEVETVINILKPLLINKEIVDYKVFYPNLIKSDLNLFLKIKNKKILNITRYGKFIFFHLNNDLVLISHLRMEGKYRYLKKYDKNKSTSLIFIFKDNTYLNYEDTRKFGIMYLSNELEYKDLPMIKKLGIEANKVTLDDLPILKEKLKRKKYIKELLLDQSILCGIGNIYADEILYASKINPFTYGKDLKEDEIKEIILNSRIILNKAIEEGGSTIHSFHPSEGVDGKFQRLLLCYGKEGEKCPNCETYFHKSFINGRGTTYCPNCQINKSLEKSIGITGPIASGKSTVLNYLKEKGYYTLSSDSLVHALYLNKEITHKISKILKINFDYFNEKSRILARQILINDKNKKMEVEKYIYKQLEEKLLEEISTHNNAVIEVPLLFKAHYEYMFKKIFVLQVNKEKQIENLNSRKEININQALKLNRDYDFKKINKVVIIKNNGDLHSLFDQIDKELLI